MAALILVLTHYPLPIKIEINLVEKFIHWKMTNETPNCVHGVKARDFWKSNWFLKVSILKNTSECKLRAMYYLFCKNRDIAVFCQFYFKLLL